MRLVDLLLEQDSKPKALIMAGGGGAGKTTLLNSLNIPDTVPIFNPDKYVEQDNVPLATASSKVEKEVSDAISKNKSFVWDTTASNKRKVETLDGVGYDIMMIMTYTHPIISFLSNFEREERSIPKAAVFSTWQAVYDLIDDYKKMLGENFLLNVNLRDGKYDKEIKAFNSAAKKGGAGILAFLDNLMQDEPEKYKSSFSRPYEIEDQEALTAFRDETAGLNFTESDESMVKELKKYFMQSYEKKGEGPGREKMAKKIESIKSRRQKAEDRYRNVLDDIAKMVNNSDFQQMLKPDTQSQIKSKVKAFFK